MTPLEQTLRYWELQVQEQQTRVKECKLNLDEGYKRLKAKFEEDYANLKFVYERSLIQLEKDKSYFEVAKSNIERGYDKND